MGTHRLDSLRIEGTEYDRRRKLTPAETLDLAQLKDTMSQRHAARMFGVSRRTVQFIWDPEKLARNKEARRLRGTDYNVREDHREDMASVRQYKRRLIAEGIFELPEKTERKNKHEHR